MIKITSKKTIRTISICSKCEKEFLFTQLILDKNDDYYKCSNCNSKEFVNISTFKLLK